MISTRFVLSLWFNSVVRITFSKIVCVYCHCFKEFITKPLIYLMICINSFCHIYTTLISYFAVECLPGTVWDVHLILIPTKWSVCKWYAHLPGYIIAGRYQKANILKVKLHSVEMQIWFQISFSYLASHSSFYHIVYGTEVFSWH